MENTYKAELHIHTPASRCYKGNKNDAEYLKIIEQAHKLDIKIIAITDHNSIEGYKIIIKQKENIINQINVLKTIQDSDDAKERLKDLEEQLNLFKDILILPGIEFEVNNGIHLLVIFNPQTEISKIQQFLHDGGFDEHEIGSEIDVFSRWSIFDLYKESIKYDCLVIDAHTDSDKGIYNTIKGMTRVHAFTDSSLVGICYKNEKQRSQIKELFETPKYERKTPIAFLKSSDSHNINEIGKEQTFFILPELKWEDFKDAFSNPTQSIFTTYPKTQNIIKRITTEENCIYINDCKENNRDDITKAICGFANANGGVIFIGAESPDIMNGLTTSKYNNIQQFIKEILSKLSSQPEIRMRIYPLKNDKNILVIKVFRMDDFIDINNDGIIFYYEKNKIIQLSAKRIQSIITQRMNDSIKLQINNELFYIQKSVLYIDTYISSLPIINSYSNKSIQLKTVIKSFKIEKPVDLTENQIEQLSKVHKENNNGVLNGNIYYFNNLQKPRLSDAFLRISIPRYNLQDIDNSKKLDNFCIVPGGAVFYSETDVLFYNPNGLPIIKVVLENNYPIKFMCAFLKSSFLLWYVKNKYNSLDICDQKIFKHLLIPNLHLGNSMERFIVDKVEKLFDIILEEERKFLATNFVEMPEDQINKYIMEYNNNVQSYFVEIDQNIFTLLNLNKDEIKIIKDNLCSSNIYVP